MKLFVSKEFVFDAAHSLPGYNGPCANLHGHRWALQVEVSGHVRAKSGMVMDFVELKRIVKEEIIDKLDHQHLNDTFDLPTAENMVMYFKLILQTAFNRDKLDVELERITLFETPTSKCEWRN